MDEAAFQTRDPLLFRTFVQLNFLSSLYLTNFGFRFVFAVHFADQVVAWNHRESMSISVIVFCDKCRYKISVPLMVGLN